MTVEKTILIGCDDTVALSAILSSLRETSLSLHNLITATRMSDLLGIARSVSTDLIILCFRNNQSILTNFSATIKKPQVPVLCFTRKHAPEPAHFSEEGAVYIYPLEQVANTDYLNSKLLSIFLSAKQPQEKNSFSRFSNAPPPGQKNGEDLSRYVLELDQKVEVLLKIKHRIAHLYPQVDDPTRVELTSIVNSIKSSAGNTRLWNDFKLYFEQTDPNFLLLLAQRHPGLTAKDLKYCCYLKMNMSNDDIRSLLGINQESVRTHKYRLKKKLLLSKEQDIRNYLRTVSGQDVYTL